MEFVGGDDEEALRLGIADVDDAQVAAFRGLADGHARVVVALAVLAGLAEDGFDFVFIDAVLIDVRLTGFGVTVEAQPHLRILRAEASFFSCPLWLASDAFRWQGGARGAGQAN